MRKQSLLLSLVLILVIVAAALFFQNKKSTLPVSNEKIRVQHTDQITGIYIILDSDTLKLEKHAEDWMVNHHYPLRPKAIQSLLENLKKLEFRSPVSRKAVVPISDSIHARGKQILVLAGNKLMKKYALYENNNNTYMLPDNKNTPFVCGLEGYPGYSVYKLFPMQALYWRKTTMLQFLPGNISIIKVDYPKNPSDNFTLMVSDNKTRILDADNNPVTNIDEEKTADYLQYFSGVSFESVNPAKNDTVIAGILNPGPFFILSVTTRDGNTQSIAGFKKNKFNTRSEKIPDQDKFWGKFENEQEAFLLKYIDFDPLLKNREYFLKN
ncbi:MAG: hypothetical protein JXJ22_05215 [Bacteroidales bacterium]|nr:hypothetical protein [Bacteroidales bacterium]